MLELTLASFIVFQCGNSDFKTREFYTKHVSNNYNYYAPFIYMNCSDVEICRRLDDVDKKYWEKVAEDWLLFNEKRLRYVPWITERDSEIPLKIWTTSPQNKWLNYETRERDFMNYRYATLLYGRDLISQNRQKGLDLIHELMHTWAEYEDEYCIATNHLRWRERGIRDIAEPEH